MHICTQMWMELTCWTVENIFEYISMSWHCLRRRHFRSTVMERREPFFSSCTAADDMTTQWALPLPASIVLIQAPVPLSIFRSNSKFDENSKYSSVKYTRPITTIFCTRHDSVTVVTCAKYRCDRSNILKLERSEFSSNFEFDRNMLSGTGARSHINVIFQQLSVWYTASYSTNTTSY